MKKILIISVIFGVSMLLTVMNIIAVEQGGQGQVTPDLTLTPNPNPLQFGQMDPGTSKSLSSSLTARNSDLIVSMITVSSTGSIFTEQNVMFSIDNTNFVNAENFDPINIVALSTFPYFVKLTIPVATPSGDFAGVITYTVMEKI